MRRELGRCSAPLQPRPALTIPLASPSVAASSGSLLANQVHDWLLSGPGVRPDEVERRLRGWMPPDRARSLALALWRVLAVAAVAHRRRCAGAELASALQRVKAPEAAATTATARALRTLPNTAELCALCPYPAHTHTAADAQPTQCDARE